jgi:multidrug efflux pump subunit AcrA (membrane-fusion protein)
VSGTVSRGGEVGEAVVAGVAPQPARQHRGRRLVAGIAVLAVLGAGVVVAGWRAGMFSAARSPGAGGLAPASATAPVVRENIAATTPVAATLGYAGSYTVLGRGGGTLTWLPSAGQVIRQGQVLYRVDNGSPVVLLYGRVPAWRALADGISGTDVSQLNRDLVALGDATRAGVATLGWDYYSAETAYGVQRLDERLGVFFPPASLSLGQAVFEPGAIRVTQVSGRLGGPASGPLLAATSDRHVVMIPLDVSQQSEVRAGDAVTVTLPDGTTTPGLVSSVGTVATTTSGSGSGQGPVTTVPVQVKLTDPGAAGALDQAPVTVYITTATARNVLAVPVTALQARSPGGYVVEVIGPGNGRRYVPVKPGIFDDNSGLVQVTGVLASGQRVVVASS